MADLNIIQGKMAEGIPLSDEEKNFLSLNNVQDANLMQPESRKLAQESPIPSTEIPQSKPLDLSLLTQLKEPTEKLQGNQEPSLFSRVSNQIQNQAQAGNIEVPPVSTPIQKSVQKISPQATKPEVIKPQAPAKDILSDLFGKDLSDEALKSAQEDAKQKRFLNTIIGAGTTIAGKGLADISAINKIREEANQPVLDIMQRRDAKVKELDAQKKVFDLANEKEKNDPNSAVSKIAQQAIEKMGKLTGTKYDAKGMSAESIEKVFGSLEKLAASVNMAEQRKLLASQNQEQKSAKQNETDFHKLGEQLTLSRLSGQAVQQAKQKVFAAERLEGLLKQFPDGNIPPIQTRELATSLGALLSPGGGSGTAVSQINELVPHTMMGNAAKIAEWVTGNPIGSKQQKFIKMYAETVEREKQIGQNQLLQAKLERVAPFRSLQEKMPESFTELLRQHDIEPTDLENFRSGKKLDVTGGYKKWVGKEDKTSEEKQSSSQTENISKQVVKKLYSPSRNQTKMIYADGSEEIKDGKI